MRVKIHFEDFEKLDKELKYLENHYVVIGVLSDEKIDSVTVKEYSIYVEYGTVNIPSRPFFRSATTAKSARMKILNYTRSQFREVIERNKTGKQALEAIGIFVKGKIQYSIKKGNWVANSPATIAKKGKNNPLIDTGTMIKSIDYEIRKR